MGDLTIEQLQQAIKTNRFPFIHSEVAKQLLAIMQRETTLREYTMIACQSYTEPMTTAKARVMAIAMHKIAQLIDYNPSEYPVESANNSRDTK